MLLSQKMLSAILCLLQYVLTLVLRNNLFIFVTELRSNDMLIANLNLNNASYNIYRCISLSNDNILTLHRVGETKKQFESLVTLLNERLTSPLPGIALNVFVSHVLDACRWIDTRLPDKKCSRTRQMSSAIAFMKLVSLIDVNVVFLISTQTFPFPSALYNSNRNDVKILDLYYVVAVCLISSWRTKRKFVFENVGYNFTVFHAALNTPENSNYTRNYFYRDSYRLRIKTATKNRTEISVFI
ncbi:hypothetical protein Bhyg_05887 [Pseudolycoriella hygida]|uniref:Uncharacterized protein n=1 Tax=Pseudolycoriella hygida TaxID=35572 RepID=A0A9Q0MZT6_9DIPT|nr:hypothetical protein Bhyg_05887 [Pseudolycoriella hygida]